MSILLAAPAGAHESDQYSLPAGRDFADLGPYFSNIVEAAVHAAVARTNDEIDIAIASERPHAAQAMQSPDHVASMVWAELFRAFPTNELLDGTLQSEELRAQYPGLVTLHWPVPSIYDDPLLLIDLSKFVRTFFRAGTVSAGGTVIGTDKVIHFINVGRIYHAKFEELLAEGQPADRAARRAIAATSANPFYSEDGFLGMFTTGIHSNADLAADLAGFKFYRNLTETVTVGTRELPPMLVRDGAHWRVRMAAGSQRFTAFVTPHWNEVLNPNKYLEYVMPPIRAAVHGRCDEVLDFYRDRHGRKRSRAQFEALESELATYFGEAYDHQHNRQGRISMAELCFADAQAAPSPDDRSGSIDALGRTPLWWAAHDGQLDELEHWLARGQSPASPDLDGETPLHAAARAGQIDAARWLLRHGSPVDATALYGVTPLMLAAERGDVALARVLLDADARPDLAGPFGRTPLHLAARGGHVAVADLLLLHGANARHADDMGRSPGQLAARAGHAQLALRLGATSASPAALNHADAAVATAGFDDAHAR